ncbi:MAG: septal ring lytic transglycosylase RlpA family protein, partial [Desulfobacterales bacterium]
SRFQALMEAFLLPKSDRSNMIAANSKPDSFEYTIQPGDTLSEIASRHYHASSHNIAAANQIDDPGKIRSGQKIRIPIPDGYTKTEIQDRLDHPEQYLKPDSSAATNPGEATEWIEHTIQPGDTIWALAVRRYHVKIDDIIRDNQIADPRKIRPGQKLRIRIPKLPEEAEVVASWYGEKYHGKTMANGDTFNMHADTIAHKDLPLGTQVELTNPSTGEKALSVITDRGPYIKGRDIDLSFSLAQKLSIMDRGVGKLLMRVLG